MNVKIQLKNCAIENDYIWSIISENNEYLRSIISKLDNFYILLAFLLITTLLLIIVSIYF